MTHNNYLMSAYDSVFGEYGDFDTALDINSINLSPKLACILLFMTDNSLQDKTLAMIFNCSVQTIKNQQSTIKQILRVRNRLGAVNAYNSIATLKEKIDRVALESEFIDSAKTRQNLMFAPHLAGSQEFNTGVKLIQLWIVKYNKGSLKLYTD